MEEKYSLDATDLMLLDLLQRDSRLTIKQLAAKVHLSTTPVFERVKRLEREGFIERYAAVLNADKIDRGFAAFCNVRLKQHTMEYSSRFMTAVQRIPEIVECYNISGDYDFMLKVYVANMHQYQEFVISILGELDCIGSVSSSFVLGVVKNTHQLPLTSEL